MLKIGRQTRKMPEHASKRNQLLEIRNVMFTIARELGVSVRILDSAYKLAYSSQTLR